VKLHIVSDLHTEHAAYDEVPPESDVVILAGDISKGFQGIPSVFADSMKIWVPGNHEYYQQLLPNRLDEVRAKYKEDPKTFIGDRDLYWIDDVAFACTTLWAECVHEVMGTEAYDRYLSDRISDFGDITVNDLGMPRRFKPVDSRTMYYWNSKWLESALKAARRHERTRKVVVVTHFPPSKKCLHDDFKGSNLNGYFINSLDSLMEGKYAPDLWVHGHTHRAMDLQVGKTRVLCNPRGYPHEKRYSGFDPDLVVEI